MRAIDHKVKVALATLLLCVCCAVVASERRALDTLPQRLVSSSFYGLGTVNAGRIAYRSRERAELFLYEVEFGEGLKVELCTEKRLLLAQPVLVAANGETHPACPPDSIYAGIDNAVDVVYPGYRDLIRSETWFAIAPAFVEDLGCDGVRTVQVKLNAVEGEHNPVPSGIPGNGLYFNGEDFLRCLQENLIPVSKSRKPS